MDTKFARRTERIGRTTCSYRRAGKCNRNPCRFLHIETPSPPLLVVMAILHIATEKSPIPPLRIPRNMVQRKHCLEIMEIEEMQQGLLRLSRNHHQGYVNTGSTTIVYMVNNACICIHGFVVMGFPQ